MSINPLPNFTEPVANTTASSSQVRGSLNTLVSKQNEVISQININTTDIQNKMDLISPPINQNLLAMNELGQAINAGFSTSQLNQASNNISLLENELRTFETKFEKDLTLAIANGSTINLIESLTPTGLTITNSIFPLGRTEEIILNNPTTPTALTFPAIPRLMEYKITLRLQGSYSGSPNQAREIFIELRRGDGTALGRMPLSVSQASSASILQNDILTRTYDENDPYVTTGMSIAIINNSGATYNVTKIQLFVNF